MNDEITVSRRARQIMAIPGTWGQARGYTRVGYKIGGIASRCPSWSDSPVRDTRESEASFMFFPPSMVNLGSWQS